MITKYYMCNIPTFTLVPSLWFFDFLFRNLLLSTFRGLLLRLLRTPSRWIPVKPKVIQLFKPLFGEPVRLFLVPLSILSTLIHYPPRQLLVQWVTVWYSTVLLFVCKGDRCWWAKVGEGDSDKRKLKTTYSFLPFKFNQFIVSQIPSGRAWLLSVLLLRWVHCCCILSLCSFTLSRNGLRLSRPQCLRYLGLLLLS